MFGISLVVFLISGCIQQDGTENCAGPGPGDPGSKVDLQVLAVAILAQDGEQIFRVDYWNAGKAAANLDEGEPDHQIALYLDRSECPPAGELGDYLLALPRRIPSEAAAEVGLVLADAEVGSGNHNVFGRIDPVNATWEADEYNNCFGPTDFTVP